VKSTRLNMCRLLTFVAGRKCYFSAMGSIHPSMFISQKSQIRNMEHTLVQ